MANRVKQWIGYLIMVAGVCFLAGPFVLGAKEANAQTKVVATFRQEAEKRNTTEIQVQQQAPESQVSESSAVTEPETDSFLEVGDGEGEIVVEAGPIIASEELLKASRAYNESLLGDGQEGMLFREDVEAFDLDVRKYGAKENVFGTIYIPRLEVELAIYLGADKSNMAKGVAVFGMTSLPLGEGSENVAIAGHRGWRGTPVFRDIQKIQMNDPIYVTNQWGTLVYRVSDLLIVTPEDNSWCFVKEGQTLLSLMTCHPYGKNYQRYVVIAELSDEEIPTAEEIAAENEATYNPDAREIVMVNADGTRETVIVDPVSIEPDGSEYGAVWSNTMILAENRMKPVAIAAAVIVFLLGIWLTIGTIRDCKMRGETAHEE